MVHEMDAEERVQAIEYWNVVSEQLQVIVNHSAEDIGGFTFHMDDEEKVPDYIDATQLVALGLAPTFMTSFIGNGTPVTMSAARRNQLIKDLVAQGLMKEPNVLTCIEDAQVTLENSEITDTCVADTRTKVESIQTCPVMRSPATIMVTTKTTATTDIAAVTVLEEPVVQEEEVTEQEDILVDTQITNDDGEENTVHLMISAESNPATLSGDTQPGTHHKKKIKKRSALNVEEESVEGSKGFFECQYCRRIFFTHSQLTAHSWTHTKPYVCSTCERRFSSKGNLVVHTRRHSGERPYTCKQCDARFSTKGNLVRHCKSHSGEKPWECTQCGSRFTEKKSLKVHVRRHTGERPYHCTICPKSFTQTGILQTHMAMHLDQRAHLCNLCGKSFRQKSQLRLHEQRHAGLRKYQCPLCSFKFLTKGDMERHKRTHTGERPFICKLCNKSFTRQQSLNEHMNRHYGLKPYQCKYCKKGYVEMSACYKHIKTHERSKTDPKTQTDLEVTEEPTPSTPEPS